MFHFKHQPAQKKVEIIGAASGYGAQNHACQDGPEVLRALGFLANLHDTGVDFFWDEVIHLPRGTNEDPLHAVSDICVSLAERVASSYRSGNFPLIIGGDHSCAIGTWSGITQALDGSGELGLLWIDAHMDSHTFATTPSGAIHGMPLACLLGYGDDELTHIGQFTPKLLPQNVCLIGTRSFEEGEAALLGRLGVRICGMSEIHARGFETVFAEALEHVQRHTAGFGVSLDLDVLDPSEESGIGSPEPGGVFKHELVRAFRALHNHPNFLAMEIVEYNPYLDDRFVTALAASELCAVATPF